MCTIWIFKSCTISLSKSVREEHGRVPNAFYHSWGLVWSRLGCHTKALRRDLCLPNGDFRKKMFGIFEKIQKSKLNRGWGGARHVQSTLECVYWKGIHPGQPVFHSCSLLSPSETLNLSQGRCPFDFKTNSQEALECHDTRPAHSLVLV